VEVKPFGPDQEYVPPTTVFAVRFRSSPSQIGLLDPRVKAAGVALTVTEVFTGVLGHPLSTTKVYVPASAVVVPVIVGFCCVDVNPFGPVQLYVAPATRDAVRLMSSPSQTGELLDTVGEGGALFTVTSTVPAVLVHPFTVNVNEYVPDSAVVALVIDGFCCAEVKPFGPVQLYVAPATAVVDKLMVCPTQMGELLDATGVVGIGLTVTATDPAGP
jgi:hypothetical protein